MMVRIANPNRLLISRTRREVPYQHQENETLGEENYPRDRFGSPSASPIRSTTQRLAILLRGQFRLLCLSSVPTKPTLNRLYLERPCVVVAVDLPS